MRVLIHTYDYVPTPIATSYRMKALADAFVDNGHDVYVLTRKTNNLNTDNLYKEKIVTSYAYEIKKKNIFTRVFSYVSFGISSYIESKKIRNVDLIITSTPPQFFSLWACKMKKNNQAKLIFDVRDIWPDVGVEMGSIKKNSIKYKIFDVFSNYMYKYSDLILTVSNGKYEKLKKKTNNEIMLVENGFDENILKCSEDKATVDMYRLKKHDTCVYIGNVGLAQGLENMLYCAENTKHKDIRFLIFGSGAGVDNIKNMIKEKNLTNVSLCGIIEHNKIKTLLAYSKICFVPLKSEKLLDSIPTKTYEALGVGCPVFLVACGDSRKLIDETHFGSYASPNSQKEIIEEFDELLDNYEEVLKNKELSKEIVVNNYSRQKISNKFVKEIECKI